MNQHIKAVVSMLLLLFAGGCAWTSRWLGPDPALNVGTIRTSDLPANIGDRIKFRCSNPKDGATPAKPECKYMVVSYESSLVHHAVTDVQRNNLVDQFMNIADQNCETFLQRAFANKAGLDSGRNLFKDLMTGAAAGLAKTEPAIAAGLNYTNLLVGSTVENIDRTYYVSKTFSAVESAIEESRANWRATIKGKKGKSVAEYSLGEALNDVQHYGKLCTIKSGLGRLEELAKQEQSKAENKAQIKQGAVPDALPNPQAATPTTQPATPPTPRSTTPPAPAVPPAAPPVPPPAPTN